MKRLLTGLIRIYQWTLSPVLGRWCRFQPSCSHYAVEAIEKHGSLRGSWLAIKRVCRCQPFCKAGYDPVPEAGIRNYETRKPELDSALLHAESGSNR